jgi:protein-S-isoprenylcysteine O-methyltransferase Ste14
MTLLWIFMAVQLIMLVKDNPRLLAERARGMNAIGTKTWDKPMVRAASIAWFSIWLLAAFDHHHDWSPSIPVIAHWLGAEGTALGFALFNWAMATNDFFTEGVRIQKERGHHVCESGPYRYIRHPGYAGNILAILSIPWLLGSYWGIIPAVLCSIFFILRTYKEDQTLMKELPGYQLYSTRTRYRLFPGVW